MRKRFQLSAVVAALVFVSVLAGPASGQTPTVLNLRAARVAQAQPFESPTAAMPAAAADPGVIAYVRPSTHDIHVISPNGSGDRVLWSAPQPLSAYPAYDLAWRPDGRELAFSSDHEEACSWYQSDIYAIGSNGAGYRRVTNSPACAALAGLPKGSVTVNVTNYASEAIQVYVQGAPGLKTVQHNGTITFHNVADFGPGALQPAIGIWGLYRFFASAPLADVQPGKTVPGGILLVTPSAGIRFFGTGKVSWKADGSALAYCMRTASDISQIPAVPHYGSIGVQLPMVEHAGAARVAWGSTGATKNQYLYFSLDPFTENIDGIYLNSVGDASGGTKLVDVYTADGETVWDIEWLPDASGFLFTGQYWSDTMFAFVSEIFEYTFDPPGLTRLTEFGDAGTQAFSISPDGKHVVFEHVDESDGTSSLWVINRNNSDLRKLAGDAGRPAWGRTPAPLNKRVYLPLVVKQAEGGRP